MSPLSPVSRFPHLTDTPGSYTGHAGKGVRVKGDESGLEFGAAASGQVVEAGTVETDGTVLWRWGADTQGRPYFDTDGVDVTEEAALIVEDGVFYAEEVSL